MDDDHLSAKLLEFAEMVLAVFEIAMVSKHTEAKANRIIAEIERGRHVPISEIADVLYAVHSGHYGNGHRLKLVA